MQRIYLDNAATTAIDPQVLAAMMPYLENKFGNPSSIYSYGRETRMAIEAARKSIAHHINAKPAEVFFTSGGTESSNTAIRGAVEHLGCKRIITSAIEHHATLYTAQKIAATHQIELCYVQLLPNGAVDILHLEQLLQASPVKTLVTLMYANNEIGNLLPVSQVGALCKQHNALFHSDAVQALGHYPLDMQAMHIDFLSGSGHKFHAPKGVGILYINSNHSIPPLLHGGGQERNMRAGTENIYGIVGMAKALDIAMENYQKDAEKIAEMKKYLWQQLQQSVPSVVYNGEQDNSLYTVLNVGFENTSKAEVLQYSLDMQGICISGGSACTSGAHAGSHVIAALADRQNVVPIRFSFCKYNTMQEIDIVVNAIQSLLQ